MRLYHEAVHTRLDFPLCSLALFPQALMMATDKPLLLSAILGCKNAITSMTLFSADHYLDIEIEGDIENGKRRIRSQYSVRLYVADNEVTKSTHPKPRSSVLKWEWNADNKMCALVS